MIKLSAPQKPVKGRTTTVSFEYEEVGVEAEFLHEVMENQRRLRQLMQAVEHSLADSKGAKLNPTFVADLFMSLKDQLALHFSLEESMGYLGEFTAAAPRLCRKAERLQSQHESLYDEICSITDEAKALCRPGEIPMDARRMAIQQRYAEFRTHLQKHNRQEDDLMVEVLYFDIGGGD